MHTSAQINPVIAFTQLTQLNSAYLLLGGIGEVCCGDLNVTTNAKE